MKLKLGFSTCPNDTFIFEAIVNKRIDTENLDFEIVMADVEELNHRAMETAMDITKLSYHAYSYIADKYLILSSGSALGYGNGPLLVSKRKIYPDEIPFVRMAIPGKYTTAAFLLKVAYNLQKEPKEYLFSDIEDAILSDEVDAGVLIHEGRFTYAKKGLQLIQDLGLFWEQHSGKAIPLGCIAMSRKLPDEIGQKLDRIMTRSVQHALNNPQDSRLFIRKHAQEMDVDVIEKHIDLFVNNFTVNLGSNGHDAVEFFLSEAERLKIISHMPDNIFVD